MFRKVLLSLLFLCPIFFSPLLTTAQRAGAESSQPALGVDRWHVVPEAHRLNQRALLAHRAGHFEDSAEGFNQVLATAAHYTAARFNLACAQARLGLLDAAWISIRRVLHEDLRGFLQRVRQDPDLTALRNRHGAALRAYVQDLELRYDHAESSGLPVFRAARSLRGGSLRWRVRPGYYLADARRFVAASQWITFREPSARSGDFESFVGAVAVGANSVMALFVNNQPNHGIASAWVEERDLVTGGRLAAAPLDTGPYGQLFTIHLGWAEGRPVVKVQDPDGWTPYASVPRFRDAEAAEGRSSGAVDPFGAPSPRLRPARGSRSPETLPPGLRRAWSDAAWYTVPDTVR